MLFTGRLSALRHRQFRNFWLASFASVGATQLQVMVQGWLVFDLTNSPLMLGYLGAAAGIPAIIMTLFGGALADRLNRKHLLMATSFVTAGLLLTLAMLDFSGHVAAWHVILITGVISVISGLDWPTRQAIFPAFIERADMMSAIALNSVVWQCGRMIFPAFGGLLIALYDTSIVLVLCALGFAIMGGVVATLKVEPPPANPAHSTMHQVREGLLFTLGNRYFLVLISLSYASMFFGASYMQLMPAFSSLLDAGSAGYGYLLSCTGVGSVAGTIIVGSMQYSKRLGWILLGSSMISALCIYAFSAVTAYAYLLENAAMILAMATAFSIAMFASVFLVSSMTVMQLAVPDELRGRVMGLHGITYSLMPLGGLFAGVIASVSSAPVAITVSATVYLLFITFILVTQHTIRNIDGERVQAAY
jgi:MFS family permease